MFAGSVTRITRKEAAMTETFRESASLKKRLYEHCTKSFCACNVLITNEILVEATGVELFRVLITRKLLIPGIATTAKKAPLPDPLYVCRGVDVRGPSVPAFPLAGRGRKKKKTPFPLQPPPCPFLGLAGSNFRIARYPGLILLVLRI